MDMNMGTSREFRCVLPSLEVLRQTGREDVAEIFVVRTRPGDDRSMIELVDGLDTRYPREEKWIINVSTQFGCPVQCCFCDAGHRYLGDLSTKEMLAQVAFVMDRHPGLEKRCQKLKVHFARMGEPAFNDNVLDTLRQLPGFMQAPNLWACVPTTAPVGKEMWFEELIRVKDDAFRGRFQLQFSINTTDMEVRRKLMPIRLHEMDWMAQYAARWHKEGDRKVVLNFALGKESPFDPQEIIRRFDPAYSAVKLTPLNPTETGEDNQLETILRTEDCTELEEKGDQLIQAGFDVVYSIGDGREDDIGSNCGQSVRAVRYGHDA